MESNFVEILPVEISELIFTNLICCDLLKAMQVHSTWNEVIGSSKTLKDNIKLTLNQKNIKKSEPYEVCEILKDSRRQYRHLELNLSGTKSNILIEVIKTQNWNSFKIRGQLALAVGIELIKTLEERCSNLVSLTLQFDQLFLIGELLKANKALKILKLQGRLDNDDIFDQRNDLKLQVLHLDTWRDYNKAPDENPQVFNTFLKTQADTLSDLSIDFGSYGPYLDQSTLHIILNMPKMVNLTINIESYFLQPSRMLQDLPDNHLIVNLNPLLNFHNVIKWGLDNETKSFMGKFHNVKTLRFKELQKKLFQFVEEHFSDTLEELIVDDTIYMSSDNSDINAFPKLRAVKFGRAINPELERRLKDAPEEELGNFSRFLLEELNNHPNNEREFRSAAIYPTFTLLASDQE